MAYHAPGQTVASGHADSAKGALEFVCLAATLAAGF